MIQTRRTLLKAGAALALAGTAGCGEDDVRLTDQNGQSVRWGDLKGRPRAVFFGFTHCPMICPVTVWELNDALDKIGATSIGIEFITIDPERDTPARLGEYLSSFGPRVRGFTGSPEAIAKLAALFDVTYRKTPLEAGGYTMDHTATVFLVNAQGKVADVVAYGSPPDVMQTRLRALAEAKS